MSPRVLACLLLLLPAAARAAVLWRADFEAGDLSSWSKIYGTAPDRLRLERPPGGGSRLALRTEVRPGDVALKRATNGVVYSAKAFDNRAEVVHASHVGEGDERWYRWKMLVPADFATKDRKKGGVVFAQWHHVGDGPPPLMFVAQNDVLRVVVCEQPGCPAPRDLWSEPLRRAHWYEFVLHVRWSASPQRGLEELWVDGAPRFSERLANLFPGCTNYLQTGQYRHPSNSETTVLWLDDWVEATAREDVLPPEPKKDAAAPARP